MAGWPPPQMGSPHPRRRLLLLPRCRLLQTSSCSSSGVASASTALLSTSSVLLVKWRRILNGVISSSTASPSSNSVILIKWRRLRIHGIAFFKQRPTCQVAPASSMASSPHPRHRLLQAASCSSSGVAFFKECPTCQVALHPQWRRLLIHGAAFFKQRPGHQVASPPHPRRRLLQAASCLSSSAASSMMSSPHPRRHLLIKWRRATHKQISPADRANLGFSDLINRERWRRVAMEQTLALDPDKAEREKLSQVAGQELDRRIFICEVYPEQNKVANALDPLGVHQQTDSAEFVSRHRPVPSQNKVANTPTREGPLPT
nr:hypothetical protein Iba_chr12aCG8660 [Ipomoea batatas]